ncbi:Cathepsin B-like cysteine proteinase 3 [Trichinella patagoniensis]|uniref:Cathepsin B-like cysteine proteinase 3 n=1 Tax=Trichinella patagoniensis TaxID=990121 RepID=A0A0V0Z6V0_9BILA|nr:Cathepsin B-like cysteine proteinase 3 [Trichinella patagoniensis]
MMLKILILLSFIFQLHGGYYEHFFHQLMRENVKPVGWKMGLNAYFAGMSRRSIMQRFGAELDWHSDKRKDEYLSQSECPILPEQFDARNQWPKCKWIGFIRDQSNCGSCWAVSGASVMSDRHCIASNGTNSPYLSDEELLSCCHYCAHGCRSGKIEAAFIYWQRSGLVTGGPYGEKACCLPYSISPCTMCRPYVLAPKCQRTCQASYNLSLKRDKYYGKSHYYVNQDEFDIMQEIYQRGPVVAGFKVYHDFLYYISGKKSSAHYLGNHAVKIIGWGKENSIPYWLVANSWNNTFGENGFARILRGKDECRIESAVFAGIPSLRNEDLRSEIDIESDVERKKKKRFDLAVKDIPKREPKPSKSSFHVECEKEATRRQNFVHLNAYERHKRLINEYILKHPGSSALLKRDTSKDKTDIDVIHENSKFLWEDDDEPQTWEQNLAKRYYDKLFKEYCIGDLSKYKEGKIALRWRIEQEVIKGKGQFICGNKRCEEEENLTSWEVNFAYVEEQEKKNALVKLRLCPDCSEKLNYKKIFEKKKRNKVKTETLHAKGEDRKRSVEEDDVCENNYIQLIKNNQMPKTWKMGLNPYFSGMSKEEILIRMGTKLMNSSTEFDSKLSNNNEALIKKLPKHFDSREKWPECEWIRFIRDQSNCGSCWAVSAASVMTDRHCIASKGQETPYISDEQILSCASSYGCSGGMIPSPFHYWKKMGIATGGPYGDKSCCQPYSIAPCSKCPYTASTPSCKYDCQADYDIPITSEHYHVSSNQYEIMNEIYTHGPVVAGFIVYEDFAYYISGIYQQTSYMAMGGHAIRIIGWGEENGIPYWLIANSWNTTFGEKGFFRIRRGTNECRIESEVYTGIPKLRLTL